MAACADQRIRRRPRGRLIAPLPVKQDDKTFAHAYLAAMGDPVARLGEGARQGVWDFTSPAFSELSGFLRSLAAIGR